jgi:hypothetical protein
VTDLKKEKELAERRKNDPALNQSQVITVPPLSLNGGRQ